MREDLEAILARDGDERDPRRLSVRMASASAPDTATTIARKRRCLLDHFHRDPAGKQQEAASTRRRLLFASAPPSLSSALCRRRLREAQQDPFPHPERCGVDSAGFAVDDLPDRKRVKRAHDLLRSKTRPRQPHGGAHRFGKGLDAVTGAACWSAR